MTVKVYSKTQTVCQQCNMTKKLLTRQGIDFVEESLEENKEARNNFAAMGYMSAPVVEVERENGEIERWAGFIPDKIRGLVVAE